MIACGVAAVNSADAASMRAADPRRSGQQHRLKPQRRRMGAAVSFIVTAPTAALKVSRAGLEGDSPKPTCSISGSRKGRAPTDRRNRLPPMIEMRGRWRCAAGVRSMMGCGGAARVPHIQPQQRGAAGHHRQAGPGWVPAAAAA
jgi:hypothetical protein